MKKAHRIFALMLAAAMIICCLTACGEKVPAGVYRIESLSGEGSDSLLPYKDMLTLEVYGKGQATLSMENFSIGYVFDLKSDKVTINGTSESTYTVSGGKITVVYDNGYTQVFVKK